MGQHSAPDSHHASGAPIQIVVQNPSRSRRLPASGRVEQWVRHALGPLPGKAAATHAQITVRFVTRREAIALNGQFRERDYAPNVLSFPYDEALDNPMTGGPAPAGTRRPLQGDIVICPPVVASEARAQGKPFEAHLAHLVVHGVLHLRGYDHLEDAQATRMERLESRLVVGLGHGDPWAGERLADSVRQ